MTAISGSFGLHHAERSVNTLGGDRNQGRDKESWECVSQFNPITGRTEWKLVDCCYDFAQEIARSGYGDMLHDTDRNVKYRLAIEKAVAYRRSTYPNDPIRVLDIGTGTGLLSMMAVNAGVNHVSACEAFEPVAKCARSVLKTNGMHKKIKLIPKHSSNVCLGSDLTEKANLLVAELVDTELIGEGALSTYRYAAEHLISEDATLVPYAADLFLQVVESPFLWSHHSLSALASDVTTRGFEQLEQFFLSDRIKECSGAPSVMDIQASELEVASNSAGHLGNKQVRCLLDRPILLKRFKFCPPVNQIKLEDSLFITTSKDGDLRAVHDGILHAFVVWWRLKMEPTNTVPDISTAPSWTDEPADHAWRDHWMQAIYFPKTALHLRKGEAFGILFKHDALSMWFDAVPIGSSGNNPITTNVERPVCNCGLHYAWSRARIAQLNSTDYHSLIRQLLDRVEQLLSVKGNENTSVNLIVCSDSTPLPLILHKRFSDTNRHLTIHHIETSLVSAQFVEPFYHDLSAQSHCQINLHDSFDSLMKDFKQQWTANGEQAVIFLSEPFTASSMLPWDSLYFAYALTEIARLTSVISVCPQRLRIWSVLVEFDHLWKIRAPINSSCENYDLTDFDNLIQAAMCETDALVEPHPLWEYPSKALSNPTLVLDMPLQSISTDPQSFVSNHVVIEPTQSNCLNGIALWAEWVFDSNDSHNYAPAGFEGEIQVGEYVKWRSAGEHQAVIFTPLEWQNTLRYPKCAISLSVKWNSATGEHCFAVKLHDSNEQCMS